MQTFSVPINDRQKSQGHIVSAQFHLKKKVVINSFAFSSSNGHSGLLSSTATLQVKLGGLPFKTISMAIPSYLRRCHHSDQTIRSERVDPPHHRCCHSCESLQPFWEEHGHGHAENVEERKKKIKRDYLPISFYT